MRLKTEVLGTAFRRQYEFTFGIDIGLCFQFLTYPFQVFSNRCVILGDGGGSLYGWSSTDVWTTLLLLCNGYGRIGGSWIHYSTVDIFHHRQKESLQIYVWCCTSFGHCIGYLFKVMPKLKFLIYNVTVSSSWIHYSTIDILHHRQKESTQIYV